MVVFIVEQSSSDSLSLTTVVRDQTPSASNAVCLGVVQIRQIVAAMDASRQLVMVCLQAELPSQSAAWSEPLQLKAGAPPFLPYFQVVTDAAAAAGHTFAPEVRHWASWSSACVGSQCRRGATVRLTAGRPRAQHSSSTFALRTSKRRRWRRCKDSLRSWRSGWRAHSSWCV
jgi:hypothetical protein